MIFSHMLVRVITLLLLLLTVTAHTNPSDRSIMLDLQKSLRSSNDLGWSDQDPCNWINITCSEYRVTRIQLSSMGLTGILPRGINNLTSLEILDLQGNNISGALPTLKGMRSLQSVFLGNNGFTSIPRDFFSGLSSVEIIMLDNNPFSTWELPDSLKSCWRLIYLSATSANIKGEIPNFISGNNLPNLRSLHLGYNNIEGEITRPFHSCYLFHLDLNTQSGRRLTGDISVLTNITSLQYIMLQGNSFNGRLPDFTNLRNLTRINLTDNWFTGPFPSSLASIKSLKSLSINKNFLQGEVPVIDTSVQLELNAETNRFCLSVPGNCDPRIDILISIASSVGYPLKLAETWRGNDPCGQLFGNFIGIICKNGDITDIDFQSFGLTGSISPTISLLNTLRRIVLSDNNLTGSIPKELTKLPFLESLDITNNQISGAVPRFRTNVLLKIGGNPNIASPPGSLSSGSPAPSGIRRKISSTSAGAVAGFVVAVLFLVALLGAIGFCLYKRKKKRCSTVQSSTDIEPKYKGFTTEELTRATDDFNQVNILGKGSFATVYKGKLEDGRTVAVKRMNDKLTGKGLEEIMSEIEALDTIRHRHIVSLMGYCLDSKERLLVYEYMPQGTLSQHLFNRMEEVNPLDWSTRLRIALDIASAVEYLHNLAQQSFIHRDLKPKNVLLGEDLRAKLADFGLLRKAPTSTTSNATVAGTIGYLDPDYCARRSTVSIKVDVYSYGVMLLELITGRKALEKGVSLVEWFREQVHLDDESFSRAIDRTIHISEETTEAIKVVAKLAKCCCRFNPTNRPNMTTVVRILSTLMDMWEAGDPETMSNLFLSADLWESGDSEFFSALES